jgi:cytochrome c biogenesis protein
LKRFRTTPRPDRTKPFENLPLEQYFTVQGDVERSAQLTERFLQRRYGKIHEKISGDEHFLYGQKGRYAHFGFYLVHLSVLFILIGSIIGSFFGFEAYVNILEGEQVATVSLRTGMDRLKLGFEVRCNKFSVDFYENGAPKEYRSNLSFLIDGKVVEEKSVLVNHPAQFRGVTFYQSNYGSVPGKYVQLRIVRQASNNKTVVLTAEAGSSLQLPGNEGRFKVADVRQDFMRMGPAVLITIEPNLGEETRFWIFQNEKMIRKQFSGLLNRFPKLNPSAFEPYTFFLEGMESKYYTGLQVNKDPGVPIVWIGCFLMVTGFFVTFFMSHRRIWVRISKKKKGIKFSIAGTSSKNPVGLQRELEHLTHNLRNLINEKG